MIGSIAGAKGLLPREIHDMLLALAERGAAQRKELGADREALMSMLGELLRDIDGNLEAACRDAQGNLERVQADREAHDAAEVAAVTHLAEEKQAVADAKDALHISTKAVVESHGTFKNAHSEKRKSESELAAIVSKRRQLETTERDLYMPFKKQSAGSGAGQKRLKRLCHVGRNFGFHEVLLSTLPAVLRKQPDRRQTFDSIALDRLEVEFARHAADLEAATPSGKDAIDRIVSSARTAQATLVAAEDARKERARAFAKAEEALAASKDAIAAARLRKRAFPAELRKAQGELARAEARLEAFRRGPLAALSAFLPIPSPSGGGGGGGARNQIEGASSSRAEEEMRTLDSMASLPDDAFREFRSFAAAAALAD
jgi:hypothetical protein